MQFWLSHSCKCTDSYNICLKLGKWEEIKFASYQLFLTIILSLPTRPVLGIRVLPSYMCARVCEPQACSLVQARITKFGQGCKRLWIPVVLYCGAISLDFQGQIEYKTKKFESNLFRLLTEHPFCRKLSMNISKDNPYCSCFIQLKKPIFSANHSGACICVCNPDYIEDTSIRDMLTCYIGTGFQNTKVLSKLQGKNLRF